MNSFDLTGVVRSVELKRKNQETGNQTAIVFLLYGPARTEIQGNNFVNAVVVRISGQRLERIREELKPGTYLDINGHLQGVVEAGQRMTHLVADRVSITPGDLIDCQNSNNISVRGQITGIEFKGSAEKRSALVTVRYDEEDPDSNGYYVPYVTFRVPDYRLKDVKAKLAVGAKVAISGRLQGVTKQAQFGSGYSLHTELIAERLDFGRRSRTAEAEVAEGGPAEAVPVEATE